MKKKNIRFTSTSIAGETAPVDESTDAGIEVTETGVASGSSDASRPDEEGEPADEQTLEHGVSLVRRDPFDLLETHRDRMDLSVAEERMLGGHEQEEDLRFSRDALRSDIPQTKGMRTLLIVLAVVGILALIGGGIGLLVRGNLSRDRAVSDYQSTVINLWDDRVEGGRTLRAAIDAMADSTGFTGLKIILTSERENLATAIPFLSSLTVPERYAQSHSDLVSFIIGYKDYLDAAFRIIDTDDVTSLEAAALDALVEDGKTLGRNAGMYRLETDFIKQDIDSTIWSVMPENIRSVITADQDRLSGEKQREDEARQQKEQELQGVEDAVEAFLQAYMDGEVETAVSLLGSTVSERYDVVQPDAGIVVDFELVSTTERELYYLVVVKVTREMPDPDFEPPLSGPVGEVPLVRRSSNQEFHVIREDELLKIDFIEFLE